MAALRDLDLRHLQALQAVAEERSFGRAADRLGFSQSAVSQQIASLEKTIGESLFDRPGGPKPVELTAAGTLLLSHATEILERVQAAAADMDSFRAGRVGELSVGTFQSVSVRVLPQLLLTQREEYPNLQIRLTEHDDQTELLGLLRTGQVDVTFVVLPVEEDDLTVVPLLDDPFVLICPRGSALAGLAAEVDPSELIGLPLIGGHPNPCQLLIEGHLQREGVDPDIVFRSGDNSAVQAMVRSGMGHAVMPWLAVDADDPEVVIRRMNQRIPPRTIGAATVTRRHLPPSVETFLDIATRVVADVERSDPRRPPIG